MRTLSIVLAALLHTSAAWAGPRLAVLDFGVASSAEEHAPLGMGMRSMLSTDLAASPDVTVVERERLEEVLAELELQQSKAVDTDTAVEIGRLLGATHLVDGSVTVQGETMRLDVRLVDVQHGEVVLGEQVSGERLAFFELEKDLAKKLLVAMAVQLAPKERAALSRIHTADWEAFVAFSEGVSAFDQDRYDEALAALDRALVKDGEFDLAELTHKEYAALIERLAQRSEALRTAAIQEKRLAQSAEAKAELDMLRGLEALAAKEGPDARQDRMAALSLLRAIYARRKFAQLSSEIDRFHGERLADHYAARYAVEAWETPGEVRPDARGDVYLKPEAWQDAHTKEKTEAFYLGLSEERKQARALRDLTRCTSSSRMGAELFLDLGERAARCEARVQVARSLGLSDEDYGQDAFSLAHKHRAAGDFDLAARYFLQRAEAVDKPRQVDDLRRFVESMRAYEAAIDGAKRPELVREAILSGPGRTFFDQDIVSFAAEHLGGPRLTVKGRWALARLRSLREFPDGERYLLLGDRPLWLRGGLVYWTTGHRADPVRSESVTFYMPEDLDTLPRMVPRDVKALLYGEHPVDAFTWTMTVDTEPDADWWPITAPYREGQKDHGVAPGAAPVGLLIGARDIQVPEKRIPGEDPVLHRPFRTWKLTLDASHITVESITVSGTRYDRSQGRHVAVVEREQVAKTARKTRGNASVDLEVRVSAGGDVTVRLDGKAHKLHIPDYEAGYVGFLMEDPGYARFSAVELEE